MFIVIFQVNGVCKNMKNVHLKPFIKWAGGKGQLINELQNKYPKELGKSIKKYAEPFVGGGAVLFDILSKYKLDEIYISDINAELINVYEVVKKEVEELILFLSKMQDEYLNLDLLQRKSYFYNKRDRFNNLKLGNKKTLNVEMAALFVFLNKTCFNGLYRVNKKGEFNVPIGSYKKPLICDSCNLRNVSKALQNVIIVCGDYKISNSFIDKQTFVYFDPPYRPITNTASFTAYTETLFNDAQQIELANFVDEMHRKSAKIVISNSDPKNSNIDDDFFDNIYSSHKIKRVQATRMINCNREFRGKISELLISNF